MKVKIMPEVIPRGSSRAGFTLMEVLVVIAIITILAAVLLPGLARARAMAHRTQCLSQMKQWALAFYLYVEDGEGSIPREACHNHGYVVRNNWYHISDPISRDVWYNVLSNYVHHPPAAAYAAAINRLGFYERESFFHCPSARFPKVVTTSRSYLLAIFSMAMNSQLINEPQSTIQFNTILRPARTALFLDNLLDEEEPVTDAQAKDNLGQPASYANRFAGRRHLKTGNIVFCDGHAASFAGEKVVETQGPNRGWDIIPAKEVIWYPDDE